CGGSNASSTLVTTRSSIRGGMSLTGGGDRAVNGQRSVVSPQRSALVRDHGGAGPFRTTNRPFSSSIAASEPPVGSRPACVGARFRASSLIVIGDPARH